MGQQPKNELAHEKWVEGSALEDAGKIPQAIKIYRVAARLGNVHAMSNLANLLDDKIDPPRPQEAVYWYKRAINLGHDTAALNLAIHYRNLGKHRWYIHWLKVAAKLGHSDAKRALRECRL